MERLQGNRDLGTYLGEQSGKDIVIVSAFASGNRTKQLLEQLHVRNRVELIVGTINAFTSPVFIDDAAELLKKRFWVDFRGEQSIHWKLYLVSPNTVVIGSANFTDHGIGLDRDTCVVIRNKALYDDYLKQVRLLKKVPGVLNPESLGYDAANQKHKDQNRRTQAAMQGAQSARAIKTPTFREWKKLGHTTFSLFVWDEEASKVDQAIAGKLVREAESTASALRSPGVRRKKPYRDLMVIEMGGRTPPFSKGDIVLCASERGGWIRFFQVDLVRRDRERKKDYVVMFNKTRYPKLFQLTPAVKAAVKSIVVNEKYEDNALSVDTLARALRV